jgi:hypothetical protein
MLGSERCSLHETFCSGTKGKTLPRRSELDMLPLRQPTMALPVQRSGKLVDLDRRHIPPSSGLFGLQVDDTVPGLRLCLEFFAIKQL